MKHLFTLLIISVAFIVMGVTTNNEEDSCTGAVGDVKYSLLDPSKFREVNGDCWVLLDGRSLASGTTLKDMGFSQIPDAQGVFIRSMEQRSSGRRDVDRAFGAAVGSYQGDVFQSHSHGFQLQRNDLSGSQCTTSLNGCNSGSFTGNYITSSAGGNETRPKNIALYTFVRVD